MVVLLEMGIRGISEKKKEVFQETIGKYKVYGSRIDMRE